MRYTFVFVGLVAALLCGCNKPDDAADRQDTDQETSSSTASVDDDSSDEASSADQLTATVEDGKLELQKIVFELPEGWSSKENNTGFVLAEFVLPRAEGDPEDGRLTVSTAGGSIEDNIARWRGQFGNNPTKESQDEIEVGDWQATIVDYSGDFSDMRGPFSTPTPKAGYRMLAAIIPVDDELHFIKATGPEKTIQENYEKFQKFVSSARPRE